MTVEGVVEVVKVCRPRCYRVVHGVDGCEFQFLLTLVQTADDLVVLGLVVEK